MMNKYKIVILMVSFVISSCNKLIDIPESKNQIESNVVFADSTLATSALLGAYFTLGTAGASAQIRMKYISLYADEYAYTSSNPSLQEFNMSQLAPDNIDNSGLWSTLYSTIYQCNSILEGVEQSPNLSAAARKKLKAEAKFLRAFSNFYLVNLYNKVPLLLTTSVNANSKAAQNTPQQVYDQIIKDLIEAKSELTPEYVGTGKVRANSWAAGALLARTYLYLGMWREAETEANNIINSNLYTPLPKLEDVFLANSKETIFQFWAANGFVQDISQLIPASPATLPTFPITTSLYQAFENTDGRKTYWISTVSVAGTAYHYPSKYLNRTANASRPEFAIVLRLSELYLIRAEALAQQNKVSDAVSDLNSIRARATGLSPITNTITQQSCIEAIAKERRLELFGEWGHRFLDLKRTGQINQVMSSVKPTWKNTAGTFPIPRNEITYNSNLIQNEGY